MRVLVGFVLLHKHVEQCVITRRTAEFVLSAAAFVYHKHLKHPLENVEDLRQDNNVPTVGFFDHPLQL